MIEQLFVKDAWRIAIYPEILATDTFWDLNNKYFVILDRVLEMTFYPQMSICTSKTYLKLLPKIVLLVQNFANRWWYERCWFEN